MTIECLIHYIFNNGLPEKALRKSECLREQERREMGYQQFVSKEAKKTEKCVMVLQTSDRNTTSHAVLDKGINFTHIYFGS